MNYLWVDTCLPAHTLTEPHVFNVSAFGFHCLWCLGYISFVSLWKCSARLHENPKGSHSFQALCKQMGATVYLLLTVRGESFCILQVIKYTKVTRGNHIFNKKKCVIHCHLYFGRFRTIFGSLCYAIQMTNDPKYSSCGCDLFTFFLYELECFF